MTDSRIWREIYVVACLSGFRFGVGILISFPVYLAPDILAANNATDIEITEKEASWISAAYSATGVVGCIFLPLLMQEYGRKFVNVLMNAVVVLGWVLMALAPNVSTVIAGRALQGLVFSGMYLNNIMMGEYCHPKRRTVIVPIKEILNSIGISIPHILVYTLTWRQMAWLGTIPHLLAAIGVLACPESPFWLAYKGRYSECASAFNWLRGKDGAREELQELISTQTKLRALASNKKDKSLRYLLKTFTSSEFLKPLSIVCATMTMVHVGGLYYLSSYLLQIMMKLTDDQSMSYYYSIGLDLSRIMALLCTSIIASYCKRRTLLFASSFVSCSLLGAMCLLNYLESVNFLMIRWFAPSLLIVYDFVFVVGALQFYMVVAGEIFPVQFKSIGPIVSGLIYSVWGFIILKYTFELFNYCKVYGTFGLYLALYVLSLVYLYFMLPETKDKPLQEIELEFLKNIPKYHVADETAMIKA